MMMRKAILAGALLCASHAFATTPVDDLVIGSLEGFGGQRIAPIQRDLILQDMPQIQPKERLQLRLTLDDVQKQLDQAQANGPTDARVCVTRCEGTGEDKVCWEVCVDNNDE